MDEIGKFSHIGSQLLPITLLHSMCIACAKQELSILLEEVIELVYLVQQSLNIQKLQSSVELLVKNTK